MKHSLDRHLCILVALLSTLITGSTNAYSPTTPFVHVVTSEDSCFFVMRPADYREHEGEFAVVTPASGTAYKVGEDRSFEKLWSVEGWYALPGDVHLSPDGRTLIHVRDLQEYIGLDGRFPEGETQNAVTIYRDGKTIAGYTAKDLITDLKKGIAIGWPGTAWVDRQAEVRPRIASSDLYLVDIIEDGKKTGIVHPIVFHLKTLEGTRFEFDLESGKILARKEKAPDPPSHPNKDPFAPDEAEQDGGGQPATRSESK